MAVPSSVYSVMDALVLDAAATAGGIAIAMALGFRKQPKNQRPAAPRMAVLLRSTRRLRRRHRRAVRAIVELAQECLERHPDGSFEAFTAREALHSYLPETLGAYLDVPHALRRVERAGQPSADGELSRQLRTLHGGLERIREAAAAAGATRMAANAAFLNERFPAPPRPTPFKGRRSVLSDFVDVIEVKLRKA